MTNQELKEALHYLLTLRAKLTDEQLKDLMIAMMNDKDISQHLTLVERSKFNKDFNGDLKRLYTEESEFFEKFMATYEKGNTNTPRTFETIPVYSVYSYFPEDYHDDEVLVAITKNKEKAEALVKAIEACGFKTFLDVDLEPACLPWVQEIPD